MRVYLDIIPWNRHVLCVDGQEVFNVETAGFDLISNLAPTSRKLAPPRTAPHHILPIWRGKEHDINHFLPAKTEPARNRSKYFAFTFGILC